jgi:hypothetical protein
VEKARSALRLRESRPSGAQRVAEKREIVKGSVQKIIPQGLKPNHFVGFIGTAEAVPFQNLRTTR